METVDRAKMALWNAYGYASSKSGYVSNLKDNLIEGVCISEFEAEFAVGKGHELNRKMLAIHSSSALVVNSFSFFKSKPETFQIGLWSSANSITFEHPLKTGLGGTPPHLDVWVNTPTIMIGIETIRVFYSFETEVFSLV